jgi:MtfA peptidase
MLKLFILFLLIGGILMRLLSVKGIMLWNPAKYSPAYRKKQFDFFASTLNINNHFFVRLSPEGKVKFINRCITFLTGRTFIGMEGLVVTEEMKVRIAATAVQITFGLRNYRFGHYRLIKIFPGTFYSRILDRYLKGGASTGGVLYFSWKDFEEGFADSSDRYNLGLHEMAHAMRLELLHGSDFDERFANYVDQWELIAKSEFEAMNQRQTSFLRSYASTNMEEFFAVCIEHFFEVPEEFKKQLPDLYNHLCFLLNLDPSAIETDYKLSPGFAERVNADKLMTPFPTRLKKNYRYDNWHWSYSFVMAGLFIALPAIISLHGKVLFTATHFVLLLALVVAVITSFHRYFLLKGILFFRHLLMFASVGGLSAVLLLLLFNLLVITGSSTSVFKIQDVVPILFEGEAGSKVILENNAYSKYNNVRSFKAPVSYLKQMDSLSISISHGILGIDNLTGRKLISRESY